MNRQNLPTLTEVVEVTADEATVSRPLPLAPESMPMESLDSQLPAIPPPPRLASQQRALIDAVVHRLQPRLDAWIQVRTELVLNELLRSQVEEVARTLGRALSAELPALAREALDEVRKYLAARHPGT
jgi:hypothetical protein